MALTASERTYRREPTDLEELPVAAGATLYRGSTICCDANGRLVVASATAGLSPARGVCDEEADNSAGGAGAINGRVRSGVFRRDNSAGADAITIAHRGQLCYCVDDEAVARTNAGNRPIAGEIEDVDANGVWVKFDPGLSAAVTAAESDGPVFTVRGASTGNVAALATFTVANDGITLVAGERILLKDQTAPAENGIYVVGTVAAGVAPLTRALDADGNDEIVPGMIVTVSEGTLGADTAWHLDTNAAITVGTTALTFTERMFGFGLVAGVANVDGAAAAAGTGTTAARIDHKHSLPAAAAPADVTKAAAAAGASTNVARADHKHDVTTAAAGAILIGDAAAEGTATTLARSDHTHLVTAPAAPADVDGAVAAVGVSTAPARADHKHSLPAAVAPENITAAAAVAGVSDNVARQDHKHDIDTAAPGAAQGIGVTAAAAVGTATTLARSDHDHALEAFAAPAGLPFILRATFTAGGGGAPADVNIYVANAPFDMRVLDATIYCSVAVGASTATLRDTAGGGGAALSSAMSTAATGVARNAATATATIATGGSMYLRLSDNGVTGEVVVLCVRE